MPEPQWEPYQPPGQTPWGVGPGSGIGSGSVLGPDPSELSRRKAYQRHRWLVMVQGAGAGLLALGGLLGIAWTLNEGVLGPSACWWSCWPSC